MKARLWKPSWPCLYKPGWGAPTESGCLVIGSERSKKVSDKVEEVGILCHFDMYLVMSTEYLETSKLFWPSGGQSTRGSASTSVLPMKIQDWSPLGWTGWISLQTKGLSRVFSNTTVQKCSAFLSILQCSAFFIVQLSHPYVITGKTIALTRQIFVGKVMSLLFICCLG